MNIARGSFTFMAVNRKSCLAADHQYSRQESAIIY